MTKKTLEDFASNGDGTYNAVGLVQFLMHCAGHDIDADEAKGIVEDAKRKALDRKKGMAE